MPKPKTLDARLKQIRLLVCDIDGVLTDGRIILGGAGGESKAFSVVDGTGLVLARLGGLQSAFLSGRQSAVNTLRARECRVSFLVQGVDAKLPAFLDICRRAGVPASAAAFAGDDLIDLPVFERAGVSIAVANALPDVRRAADWVTRQAGGQGAVREIVDRILRAQGIYARTVARYLRPQPENAKPSHEKKRRC